MLSRKNLKRYLLHQKRVKRSWGVNSGKGLKIIIIEKTVLLVDKNFYKGKYNIMHRLESRLEGNKERVREHHVISSGTEIPFAVRTEREGKGIRRDG